MSGPEVCEPWPVDWSCCKNADDADEATLARWQMVASQILFRLSGRRWGPSCPVTVRPCKKACADTLGMVGPGVATAGGWVPYIGADGVWRNASVCGCSSSCSCTELCEVQLVGPVYDIVEILVDGEALVPEAYRVDSANVLVRTDGECWPECQDMAAPCGAPGTVCVTYRAGLLLDESATAAVSALACHLLQGCKPGSCGCSATARNVTRIQRQGVDMEMADPLLLYTEGLTGIPVADAWLMSVNPGRLSSPSRVYSPDYRPPRRTTWP